MLADELAAAGHGLIMVMGKGGVGKTTADAALALGLIQCGKTVHLSTTDPAAHLAGMLTGDVQGSNVSRTDPKGETQRYGYASTRSTAVRTSGSSRSIHRNRNHPPPELRATEAPQPRQPPSARETNVAPAVLRAPESAGG